MKKGTTNATRRVAHTKKAEGKVKPDGDTEVRRAVRPRSQGVRPTGVGKNRAARKPGGNIEDARPAKRRTPKAASEKAYAHEVFGVKPGEFEDTGFEREGKIALALFVVIFLGAGFLVGAVLV